MLTENERFVSIQLLRFLAASAVVLAHLESHFGAVLKDSMNDSHPLWRHLNFGAAGVDLFFVISGFVMVYASERFFATVGGGRQFLTRRLLRIVPLYWVCTTFWLLWLISVHDGIKIDDLSYGSIAGSYLFIPIPRPSGITAPVLGVGWSLNLEMIFYLVFAVAVAWRRYLAVAISSLALYGLVYIASHDASKTLVFYNDVRIYQFIMGMAVGLIYRSGLRIPLPLTAIVFSLGALVFIYADEIPQYYAQLTRPYAWGCAFAVIIAACVMCKNSAGSNLHTRAVVLFGDSSYALYLTHTITLSFMGIYFPNFKESITGPISLCILPLAVCLVVAVMVHWYVEKPISRLLQRYTIYKKKPV